MEKYICMHALSVVLLVLREYFNLIYLGILNMHSSSESMYIITYQYADATYRLLNNEQPLE